MSGERGTTDAAAAAASAADNASGGFEGNFFKDFYFSQVFSAVAPRHFCVHETMNARAEEGRACLESLNATAFVRIPEDSFTKCLMLQGDYKEAAKEEAKEKKREDDRNLQEEKKEDGGEGQRGQAKTSQDG